MNMNIIPPLIILCTGVIVPNITAAQFTTDAQIDPTDYGDVRVIDGGRDPNGSHWLGVVFDLKDGWKTYWEFPGPSGLAPYFDFGDAAGIAEIIYHWPEPHLIGEDGIESVGYSEGFTLPIEIIPMEGVDAPEVNLMGTVGVCDAICIPADIAFAGRLRSDAKPENIVPSDLAYSNTGWEETQCPEDFDGWALHIDAINTMLTREPDPDLPANFLVNRDGICAVEHLTENEGDNGTADTIAPIKGGIDAAFDGDFEFELLDQ